MMIMPPRLRKRSWRAIAQVASMLVLKDRIVKIAVPDKGPGVDIDGGHRLGLVDDQIAPDLSSTLRSSAR